MFTLNVKFNLKAFNYFRIIYYFKSSGLGLYASST